MVSNKYKKGMVNLLNYSFINSLLIVSYFHNIIEQKTFILVRGSVEVWREAFIACPVRAPNIGQNQLLFFVMSRVDHPIVQLFNFNNAVIPDSIDLPLSDKLCYGWTIGETWTCCMTFFTEKYTLVFKGTVLRKSTWALNVHFSKETTTLPFIWVWNTC